MIMTHLFIGCYRLDNSLWDAGDVGKVELVMSEYELKNVLQLITPVGIFPIDTGVRRALKS